MAGLGGLAANDHHAQRRIGDLRCQHLAPGADGRGVFLVLGIDNAHGSSPGVLQALGRCALALPLLVAGHGGGGVPMLNIGHLQCNSGGPQARRGQAGCDIGFAGRRAGAGVRWPAFSGSPRGAPARAGAIRTVRHLDAERQTSAQTGLRSTEIAPGATWRQVALRLAMALRPGSLLASLLPRGPRSPSPGWPS